MIHKHRGNRRLVRIKCIRKRLRAEREKGMTFSRRPNGMLATGTFLYKFNNGNRHDIRQFEKVRHSLKEYHNGVDDVEVSA